MPWNSSWPVGSQSVKANKTPGQQNTTYTETTLNNDHYWNIGGDYDGYHNSINMPAQDDDIEPATVVMDGVLYLKQVSVTNGRIEGFYTNTNGTYQFIPSFVFGDVTINSSSTFVNILEVPANSYGDIYIWRNGTRNMQTASFISDDEIVEAFSNRHVEEGTSDDYFVEFLNGDDAEDLNIKARRGFGSAVFRLSSLFLVCKICMI